MFRTFFLSVLLTLLLMITGNSQDCPFYFPVKPETTLEYHRYDARGRLISVTTKKVVSSVTIPGGYLVKAHLQVFDNLGNMIDEDMIEVKCKGDEFYIDMSCYFHNLNLSQFAGKEVRIESDTITIPKDPAPGLLPSFVTSRISIMEDGLPVNHFVVNVYYRIVEGYENVTTPAGTFNCLKISYEVETIVTHKVKSRGIEWFSKEAGLVKRETYDMNRRLIERIVLNNVTTTQSH